MERKAVLVSALKAAGAEVLKYDVAQLEIEIKSSASDFATEADIASEKVIVEIIKEAFPNDVIISEETSEGQELLTKGALPSLTAWVLDPIDGTNNFKHGMAYSAVSIGYVEKGEIVLGGILNPYRDAIYIAEKSKGSVCNGQPIHVSKKQAFDAGTRVCTSNSYEDGSTQQNLSRYEKLGHVWVDVLGSSVLIMADVASGKLDLYHHNSLKPWDNAAGFLIASEAGAKIAGFDGQPVTWLTSEVVMGNPQLVDEFVKKVAA